MTMTPETTWRTGWTAKDPLQIGFVHVPADSGTWEAADVPGLESRDLGLAAATDGRMAARHLRAAQDAEPEIWLAHDVDVQVLYVLRGSVTISQEDGTQVLLEAGGAAYHPGLHRYGRSAMSPDFEAVEITAPARFETFVGRDARLPTGGHRAGDPVYTDDGEQNYVMAAGPRPYFKYRDLGTRGPTEERMHIHVVRATGRPGEGTGWHYHTMAQWFMILAGRSEIRVEDGPRTPLLPLDTMCIGSGPDMRHNVAPFSGDYAVLEMCVPAEYDTVAVDPPDGAAD